MSDKSILQKLYLKPGYRAVALNAPESYERVLAEAPAGVDISKTLDGKFDFIHYFAATREELERVCPSLKAAMKPGALLWVSYPKGKAMPTDLNRDILRELLMGFGLQAVSQVAIDEVWSALRFKQF